MTLRLTLLIKQDKVELNNATLIIYGRREVGNVGTIE